ncbi:GntR family transcriptional regulator [uncultured Tateyamaria sp.]|uniref:GntR family transcriptional regulator n=1 Tax=Tateyamaria sp. 1078 TaxID=3417464 RepID=UPI002602F7D9|nr:GntR family transcriptional regulator [uncultured Tateyamaria sp.]
MSRAAEVYEELKTGIRLGDLPPGYQAPEPELAKKYGVSRSTIREALVRLEGEGFIELIPRRGARVLPLAVEDLEEIYQILSFIEPNIARVLAQRNPSAEDLAPLEKAVVDMEEALATGDLAAWAQADDEFHMTLLKLLDNGRLQRFLSELLDQAHRARMVTLRMRELPAQSTQEQRQILEAIKSGDGTESFRVFSAHRERASLELVEILRKTGIRQF